VGAILGVGVGLGVAVAVAVAVGVCVGVAVAVAVAVGLGLGVTLGVELGVGVTLGVAVGVAVAVAVGVAVGVGVGVPPDVARYRTSANSTPPAFCVGFHPTATILPSGCNTASLAAEFRSPSEVRTFPPTPKLGSSEPSGLHRAKRKSESSNSVLG
jgi:hypothetical protein